ncbi:hypothetical protein LBMAG56_24570 [Verrucomicrobiota bacterium]|nr:hypothetical protein LBMAG56_24570 [Verrucomicrobiota bacterium]
MTTAEILHQLEKVPDRASFAPYETALLAATEQREAITPELIAALDRVSDNPAHYLKHHDECQHLFAIYLLAQFREPRARDAIIRLFSLPEDQAMDLTGDMVTEHGAAILASVCGGQPDPLLQLALDESVNEFVRAQAIDALLVQHLWDERPRDAVIADLRRLFSLMPKPGNSYLWAALVGAVVDFSAVELVTEARQSFTENLVDEGVIDLDFFEAALFKRPGESLRYFRERNEPIDAVAECSLWQCFRPEDDSWPRSSGILPNFRFNPAPAEPFYSPDLPPLPPLHEPGIAITTGEQPYHAPPKIGRNDPCPCGSGKKHKKCCGKN